MLRVSGKNFDIGESLRQHVLERVAASTTKYFDGSLTGHVVIDREGTGYRTDCALHLPTGITLHAMGVSFEPYASFEQAAERIDKRLRRYKRRLNDRHGAPAREVNAADSMVAHYTIETPDHEETDETEFHPVVIAERNRPLKLLPVAAAVTELDFTGVSVLAFRHATTQRVNFVYRRKDGNIGWLDPVAAGSDSSS
jgi:ribosomal subunit interface protein